MDARTSLRMTATGVLLASLRSAVTAAAITCEQLMPARRLPNPTAVPARGARR